MHNPFVKPDSSYKRDINLIAGYQNDAAKYLQLSTGQSFDECLAFVRKTVAPNTPMGLKDPKTLVLSKNPNGDRAPAGISFMKFLGRIQQQNLLISPSMAVYLPETQRESTHAQYIAEGVKNRKKVKKEMMVAKGNKDFELAKVKDGEQNVLKINNNSYSGATVSTATILYYKSTHSSLTSTCRSATSYANAANEKFIMGNRHYYTPEITKANLVSIINHSDVVLIEKVCEQHGLVFPSVDQTMTCIRYSTDNYWRGENHLETIRGLVTHMTPAERAAVVYVNDMYHLHQLNPAFVVNFLSNLTILGDVADAPSDEEYNTYHEDVRMLATFLCFDRVKGRNMDKIKQEEPEVVELIKSTAKRVLVETGRYSDLVSVLWLSTVMPSSIHAFPSIYRKAVVVSDTDSTMFTLQYWIEQCQGHIGFDIQSKRVAFVMVYLISSMVAHLLAMMSANMGVATSKLRMLAMKNEYYFAVMSLTTRSKHYYASQDAQEGLMFDDAKMEIKGVGLRDSKVPKIINDGAKKMMEEIINTIKAEKKLNLHDILKQVGDIERSIIASIESGSSEYMTSGQIKSKESYKNADNATYLQYEMWRDVFAPYLGMTKEPPYSVVKVSLQAGNKTEIDAWCERMNHPALAERLKTWLMEKRRTELTTLMIPSTVVETTGVPKVIIAGIDTRKIISNTMGVYYLMLESLGIFMQDKNITRLISDYY